MRDEHEFVDDLLDTALKRYGNEEPREGFETRILAGVRGRQRAVRRRLFAWAAAACAGALVIAALTLNVARGPRGQSVPRTSLPPEASGAHRAPLQVPKAPAILSGRQPLQASRPSTTRPRRPEEFPTPLPPTEQEKLLLAYVRQAAQSGPAAATAKPDEAPLADLEIPAINITPLYIEPLDDAQSESGK
jgi:hypothetical protein